MLTALILSTAIKCAYVIEVRPEHAPPYTLCASEVRYDSKRDILMATVKDANGRTVTVDIEDEALVFAGDGE